MTTTVTHDAAMACADLLPGDFETTRERLAAYIAQQAELERSTQALREAVERLCAAVEGFDPERDGTWQRMHDACADLRSALAAEKKGTP